jgi:hypothetical protein
MTRVISLLCVCICLLGLFGCGGESSPTTTKEQQTADRDAMQKMMDKHKKAKH